MRKRRIYREETDIPRIRQPRSMVIKIRLVDFRAFISWICGFAAWNLVTGVVRAT